MKKDIANRLFGEFAQQIPGATLDDEGKLHLPVSEPGRSVSLHLPDEAEIEGETDETGIVLVMRFDIVGYEFKRGKAARRRFLWTFAKLGILDKALAEFGDNDEYVTFTTYFTKDDLTLAKVFKRSRKLRAAFIKRVLKLLQETSSPS